MIASHFKGKDRRSSLCKCSLRTTEIIITTLSHHITSSKCTGWCRNEPLAMDTVSQKKVPL